MDFETIKKLEDCCSREAALRANVYPKFIASGRMTKENAAEEIRLMRLAAACFNKLLEGEAPDVQKQLFDIKPYETAKRYSNYDGY